MLWRLNAARSANAVTINASPGQAHLMDASQNIATTSLANIACVDNEIGRIRSNIVEDFLQSFADASDYAFFFEASRYFSVRKWRTDDLHYALYRFLRDGDRRSLLIGLLRGGVPLNDFMLETLEGKKLGPQSKFPRPSHCLTQREDIVVKGRVLSRGSRSFEADYSAISRFLAQYSRPFSVLDLESTLGYFSIRIAEDFDATCVCTGDAYAEWLRSVLVANESAAIFALRKTMNLVDLQELGRSEHFDVLLAPGILDRIDAPNVEIIDVLRRLADYVIIEVPAELADCIGPLNAIDLNVAQFVGAGQSGCCLGSSDRSLFVVPGHPPRLDQPYIAAPPRHVNKTVEITTSFQEATFIKEGERRPFIPGINAHTFLYYGGFYPDLTSFGPDLRRSTQAFPHFDVTWWNVVLSRHGATVIDGANDPYHYGFEDDLQLALLKNIGSLCAYPSLQKASFHFGLPESWPHLVEGWLRPRGGAVKSSQNVASIALPSRLAERDIVLTLHLRFASEPGVANTHSVTINGTALWYGTHDCLEEERLALIVPKDVWNRFIPVWIEIGADGLVSAARGGFPHGASDLAVELQSIEIDLGS